MRKTRHNNWRVPPQRFAGFQHTLVAPRCSSPECDTTQTVAHHTGSGVVAFLAKRCTHIVFLPEHPQRRKAAALSLKSIPRPGLTQLGFDFLALDTLGRRHFLTLDAGMGFPHLYTQHPHGSRDQKCRTLPPRLAVQGFLNNHPTRPAA